MNNFSVSLKKITSASRKKGMSLGRGPVVDWEIIFFSTLMLVFCVIATSIFIFFKIDKGEIFVVERSSGEAEKVLNLELLSETVSYYETKLSEFERVRRVGVSSVDPSL